MAYVNMVIDYGKTSEFYLCPNRKHFDEPPQGKGKKFYSELHAKDHGWVKTDYIKFCPPDEPFVWVCPRCAKTAEWQK